MPDNRSLNLLTEPVITTTLNSGRTKLSLPELLAACATDLVTDFPHLRPFQEHPWHALLVQLATLAMIDSGLTRLPTDAPTWRSALGALTHDDYPNQEPWHLLVEDQSVPAFLQPPTMDPSFTSRARLTPPTGHTRLMPTPDAMDIPVFSRHHDVKLGTTQSPATDHWLFALVSCQTANGYSGGGLHGLHGISRMNGTYGNRHGFSITPSTRWGAHIARDARILATTHRSAKVRHLLLWTIPWHGEKDEFLNPADLHPHPLYIEVARRLRLTIPEGTTGQIHAVRATTRSRRIDAAERHGLMDDPWTLQQKDKSITIAENGFRADYLAQFLNPNVTTIPLLARHHPEADGDRPMHLIARAIARGQGGTEGYHTLTLPVSNETARMFDNGTRQERLAEAAQARVDMTAEAQRILGAALNSFTGVPTKTAQTWIHQLQEKTYRTFWQDLELELHSPDPQPERVRWANERLVPIAREALKQAHTTLSTNRRARYESLSKSLAIFHAMLRASEVIPKPPPPEGDDTQDPDTASALAPDPQEANA